MKVMLTCTRKNMLLGQKNGRNNRGYTALIIINDTFRKKLVLWEFER